MAGFRSYLYKYRRDLLLSRHGVAASSASDAAHTRLRDVGARLRLRAPSTAMRLQPATMQSMSNTTCRRSRTCSD